MAQIVMETSEYESLKAELEVLKNENLALNKKIIDEKVSFEKQLDESKEKLAEAALGKHVTFSDFAIEDYKNYFVNMINKINTAVNEYKSNTNFYRSVISYSTFTNNMLNDLSSMCEKFTNDSKNKELLSTKKYVGLEEAYNIIKEELLVEEKKNLQVKIDKFELDKERFNIERSKIYQSISDEKNKSLNEIYVLKEKTKHDLENEKNEFEKYVRIESDKINISKDKFKEEVRHEYEYKISDLENKIAILDNDYIELEKRTSEFEIEKDEFKNKYKSLTNKIDERDKKIKSLKRDLDLLVDSGNFVKSANK